MWARLAGHPTCKSVLRAMCEYPAPTSSRRILCEVRCCQGTWAGAGQCSNYHARVRQGSGAPCPGQETVWVECQLGRAGRAGACLAAARHTGVLQGDRLESIESKSCAGVAECL